MPWTSAAAMNIPVPAASLVLLTWTRRAKCARFVRTETEHSNGRKLRVHDSRGRTTLPCTRSDWSSSSRAWSSARPDQSMARRECRCDGWAMTPSGTRGVLNDALSIYFGDPTLATAFVARWCAGYQVETAGGVLQVREDEPTPRVGASLHRTP